jgi:DNA primase
MIFPVFENGTMVYFQARALYDKGDTTEKFVKCLNPPKEAEGIVPPAQVVYNIEQAASYPTVAICEGPMDVLSAGPDAVATFGKKITEHHIAKLKAYGVEAVDFMWDGPGPTEPMGAWPEMLAAAPTLAQVFKVRVVFLPFGDPGERSKSELDAMRQSAPPYEYLLEQGYFRGSKTKL